MELCQVEYSNMKKCKCIECGGVAVIDLFSQSEKEALCTECLIKFYKGESEIESPYL